MSRYWLHRISHCQETSRPLLEKGFLTIGFSDFSNSEFLNYGWNDFNEKFQEEWDYLPRSRHFLWRFLHEMSEDDFVLVPGEGTYSVYEIKGVAEPIGRIPVSDLRTWTGDTVEEREGLLYTQDKLIDLGFFRRVKLHRIGGENGPEAKDINRYEYADNALTRRLRFRGTNADISDLENSIRRSLAHYRNQKPLNLHSRIVEEMTERILDLICEELTPDKFESLIKWYFRKIGASAIDIPPRNEPDRAGDADIIATFEPIKTIIYVQAKFHGPDSETDEWAVEQIREYVDYSDTEDDGYSKISWVVSTCDDFTERCQNMANLHGVTLINGQEFARMLIHAGIEGLDTAFD